MRVAILEWICGGGMHAIAVDAIPASLASEGHAMLTCLLEIFSQANVEVVTLVDTRLVDQHRFQLRNSQIVAFNPNLFSERSDALKRDPINLTIKAWTELASTCDLALIVAPEIDGILQRCVHQMNAAGVALLNCFGDFLDITCSKFRTAMVLSRADIEHPPTFLPDEFSKIAANCNPDQIWCIKSDLGAGCDGLHIGNSGSMQKVVSELMTASSQTQHHGTSSHVVQPWVEGRAFSCSAIVDRNGKPRWFPLATQCFAVSTTIHGCSTRVYQGGCLVADNAEICRPTDLLDRVVQELRGHQPWGVFGWIGVDLLLDKERNWVVIEVNPRMTTSVIGLSQASPVNLAELMLAAFAGKQLLEWSDCDWKFDIAFNAGG